jgi:multiple sugar transport system ATP-binding protein
MAEVRFDGVTVRFGDATALDGFTAVAADRAFTVLTGPPGAGKSVLLRTLVGLETPASGRVTIDGRDVTTLPPAQRPIGYVPQSFALYPHLTVRDNIGYPLQLARAPAARIAETVDRVAAMLSIDKLLDKTPDQLSGGEKQRVAVARGLARDARVFVLDDPLVGLDYKLRERLMGDLKALRIELDATFLYATSDPLEALTMAQDLLVVEGGRLVQGGPVDAVYAAPDFEASLRLVGFPRANLAAGVQAGDTVTAGPLRFRTAARGDGPVTVGFRPEALQPGADAGVAIEGAVSLVEDLGGETVIYVEAGGLSLTMVRPLEATGPSPRMGERIVLSADPAALMVFDAATGRALTRGAA